MLKEEKDTVSLESETAHPHVEAPARTFRWKVSDDHSPPQVYNRTLYLSVMVFGILGCARGYDDGCIAGAVTQPSFIKKFGLADKTKTVGQLANLKSNITSMVQLGAIGGAILAVYTVDRFGRIRALQGVCVLWLVAAIIQVTSNSVGQLYAGRLLEGFAIGQTTTIGPNYLSEVAPKAIRGLCGCIFAGAVYFGIMLGYFANYGTALHVTGQNQWVIPTAMKLILAGLILIGSFVFCVESPRWYMKVGNPEMAAKNLAKLRHLPVDHPYILGEISDINEQIETERREVEGTSYLSALKEFCTVKSVRYRFFVIALMAQLLGQWSGANAITIYSPQIFAMAGVQGQIATLKMTAVLGVVKFVSAYLSAFFLIDFFGRRRLLYCGITLQMICILYFAIYLTVVPQAAKKGAKLTSLQDAAGKGAMAAIFLSGTGWTMGFNSVQYLLGSEIFPLRIRSVAQSFTMVFHFVNIYANSKALPSMLLHMNNYGAFYFFVAVMLIALVWVYFFVPEIAGRSLESMEEVFSLPWYLIGRRAVDLCPDYSEVNKISYTADGSGNAHGGDIAYIEKPTVDHIEEGLIVQQNDK